MKTPIKSSTNTLRLACSILLIAPLAVSAQAPVDENGNDIGSYQSQAEIVPLGADGIPRLSSFELQELVGPVALYPDDLLAIVLPASAYPLQIAEAARFIEAQESDPALEPDPEWDDSVVALVNYPEVVELMNDDLDWTYRLGEAVIAQQTDVVAAVESFRDRAYAAGNLKSDAYQTVSNDGGVVEISPVSEDVIYVPYYEPARVVVYQPRPSYYYYPRPYPVYYYPYSAGHYFDRGRFWGVTTAFSIGWRSDSLHVYHQSYRGHPYYGRSYWDRWWYRRPSISVYNTTYINSRHVNVNRYSNGDRWHPRRDRREYVREGYARDGVRTRRSSNTVGSVRTSERNIATRTPTATRQARRQSADPIRFRDRGERPAVQSRDTRQVVRSQREVPSTRRQAAGDDASRRARQTGRVDAKRQAPTPKLRAQQPVRQVPARQSRQQSTQRQEPARQSRQQSTRRQEPARQSRQQVTRRQEPARQSRQQTTRRQEPARRASTPSAQRSQPARSERSSSRRKDDSRSRSTQRRR